jgi:hypothetical protein
MQGGTLVPMKVRAMGWVVALLASSYACAQTDVRGLESALKGKQFILRSYSADKVARFTWIDGRLVDGPASVRTLGVVLPDRVTF